MKSLLLREMGDVVSGSQPASESHSSMAAPQNKLNIELPYEPVIVLLGIFPRELKAGIRIDSCTSMFMVMLFTTAERWKQPKCPSTDEWISKCSLYIQCGIIKPYKGRKS